MFLGLTLTVFGLAWMLNVLGVYDDETFGTIGSVLVVLTGLIILLHPHKSRKDSDLF